MSQTALESALNTIPSDDRELWVRMGMAVKHELGNEGFDVWDSWSRTSESYREADARSVWRSIDETGGVTIGSLIHEAKRCGWDGELRQGDRSAMRKRDEHRKVERERAAARRRAAMMLSEARIGRHPYLITKGFPLQKVFTRSHLLLMPMRDLYTNQLQSLQMIEPDGSKRFLAGGRARGCVYRFGSSGATPWHCEGFATGLSVHNALNLVRVEHEIVVCFSAGNLGRVAKKGYVIADNDEGGAGERYAAKTGLPYWMPDRVGDANDFHLGKGIEALAIELAEFAEEVK